MGGGASSWGAKTAKQSILNCRKCDKTVFLLGKGKTKNEMKLVIVYKTRGRMLMVVGWEMNGFWSGGKNRATKSLPAKIKGQR